MQRIIIIIYAIVTGSIAVISTFLEIQPALFIINFFAPNEGDKYYIQLVMLLTWLILLLPLFTFILVARLLRIKGNENIPPDRMGIFVTRKKSFQSALVGIPVFVNGKKSGILDNGRTKFFETPSGMHTVQVGNGKQASEIIHINLSEGKQLHFKFEIKQVKKGQHAEIILKMNSLSDEILIEYLYEAAKQGVIIKLIIRGIFCMLTDLPKLKNHIQAISIVDEYLEHARLFVFFHGGNEKIFISSADWMVRNLDHRVEATCPINNTKLKKELRDILNLQWQDNVKARLLDEQLNNIYKHDIGKKKVRSQVEIMNYLSNKKYR